MGPGEGVIIVYVPDELAGRELVIANRGRELSAIIGRRILKGKVFACQVFGFRKPGEYRIRCPYAKLSATVTVEAGKVTRVDWRTALRVNEPNPDG
jgi:hypothetical protein